MAMQKVEEQVNIQVLGPFRVQLLEKQVTPTAAKQRQILALLALNAGRVVPVRTLLDEIWGDDPPSTCLPTLQTYISQMRNRFATALPRGYDAREFISTHHGGYMLRSDWFQTDVAEFERIARMGRAASERGDYQEASDTLTKALELWQGPILSDVPCGRILELETISLEEKRVGVLNRRIESDLALQRHSDVLGDLRLLTAKYPMNENLSGFFIIALYRSGRVARALEEFRRLRAVLRSELGIDPSPKLERLHQLVLARDPSLDGAATEVVGARR